MRGRQEVGVERSEDLAGDTSASAAIAAARDAVKSVTSRADLRAETGVRRAALPCCKNPRRYIYIYYYCVILSRRMFVAYCNCVANYLLQQAVSNVQRLGENSRLLEKILALALGHNMRINISFFYSFADPWNRVLVSVFLFWVTLAGILDDAYSLYWCFFTAVFIGIELRTAIIGVPQELCCMPSSNSNS